MNLNQQHLSKIVEEAHGIKYGRLIIEINETAQSVDIISEKRIRMPKDQSDQKPGQIVASDNFHRG